MGASFADFRCVTTKDPIDKLIQRECLEGPAPYALRKACPAQWLAISSSMGKPASLQDTALLNAVTRQLDANKRTQMLNQVEAKYIVNAIPSIPLFARPAFVLQSKSVKGPVLNPTTEGVPWNISSWTVS